MRRKTEAQKRVEGTARKDRVRKTKVIALKDLPAPQSYLPKKAHGIYYEICRHLHATGQFSKIDGIIISAAANSINLYAEAAKAVNNPKIGLIQKFKNGTRNLSPEFSVMQKLTGDLTHYTKLLGLDLLSREKILAFSEAPDEPAADPAAALLNKVS